MELLQVSTNINKVILPKSKVVNSSK